MNNLCLAEIGKNSAFSTSVCGFVSAIILIKIKVNEISKDDSNLGWILVGISLLIMIFLIVNFILTLYSTTYASVVGVTSATGDIIGAFKN